MAKCGKWSQAESAVTYWSKCVKAQVGDFDASAWIGETVQKARGT